MPRTFKSLGAAIHYQTHLRLQLAEDPDFPLPELAGSWFIGTSGEKRGSKTYPTEGLVYAIDRRAGVTDLQAELNRQRSEEIKRLNRALRTLREFDELMYRATVLVCIKGQVKMLPGSGMRHCGTEPEAAARYFDGDQKLLQDWLTKAWELLALVLAPPEVIQSALAQGAVWRRAHDWLQERRNGHGS